MKTKRIRKPYSKTTDKPEFPQPEHKRAREAKFDPSKLCKCGRSSDFYSNGYTRCKLCISEYGFRRRADPEFRIKRRTRESSPRGKLLNKYSKLRTKYHLSMDNFNAMLDNQAGLCAICCEPLALKQGTVIDHDHKCCKGYGSCGDCVRGLLCNACNTGLAYFKDDLVRLESAMEYIKNMMSNPMDCYPKRYDLISNITMFKWSK
jgi:hypothetical protein